MTTKLGKIISEARQAKGLSQTELALTLGYRKPSSKASIGDWESGRQVPPPGKLGKLCRILGLDVREVVGLVAAHKWGELDPEVAESLVHEQTARYEKAPADPHATAFARDLADLQTLDREALILIRKTAALVARLLRRREQEGEE